MSVLIKGIEMPKSCWQCQFLAGYSYDGLCKAANRWLDDDDYFDWYQYPEGDIDTIKPINCPLVEIPTPHGRLIDADALVKSMRDFSYMWGERMNDEWVGEAPTIIESETGDP